MTRTRRGTCFGLLLSAAAISATGCIPFAPTRPSAIENVSITVQEDEIAIVQCITEDYRVNYVSLNLVPSGKSAKETTVVYSAEIDYKHAVLLDYKDPVVFSGMRYILPPRKINEVRVSELRTNVDLYLAMYGPDAPVEMSFLKVDPKALKPGLYVHSSGEMNNGPCGR